MEVPHRPRRSIEEMLERFGKGSGLGRLIECGEHGEREFLLSRSVPSGVPRGVICEVIGTARTEWVLSLFVENPSVRAFWCEKKLTLLPTAVHQRGVDLSRVLIAEAGDQLFQAIRKALTSKLFDCVVVPGVPELSDEVKTLKALQLFARQSNACLIFLSETLKSAWAIPFQAQANWAHADGGVDARSYRVEVLKSKWSRDFRGGNACPKK